MPRSGRLGQEQVTAGLGRVEGWTEQGGALHREFEFRSFADAFAFMTRVAFAAESMDHHPDWSNSYNRVVVRLSSHDAGGISDRDFRLAEAIDAAWRQSGDAAGQSAPADSTR
jgi:4a-hydroxytetrahydrobiopterin dehydratase